MKQNAQKRNMVQLLAMISSRVDVSFIAIDTEDLDTSRLVAIDVLDMPHDAFFYFFHIIFMTHYLSLVVVSEFSLLFLVIFHIYVCN